jgi:zinc-ribbon domain
MAFCNSCGTNLAPGAKFCPKCGAAVPAATATAPASVSTPASTSPVAAAPPPAQGSGALKIILIVVAVIVGIMIIGGAATGFFIWRIAHHSHIRNENGNVRVETPFGTVESTDDPAAAARSMGVDLYPGATAVKGGSANLDIGGMHTASLTLESKDPASTVADFYKSRYPNANVTSADNERYTIVSTDKNNLVTINIQARDGATQIHIARITGKMIGGTSN